MNKKQYIKVLKTAISTIIVTLILTNAYNYFYSAETGYENLELINTSSVSLLGSISIIAGCILFFLLDKFSKNAKTAFTLIILFFTILSLGTSLMTLLPNGDPVPIEFSLLSIGLHIIVALTAVFFIPFFAKLYSKN
jgi:hypothetical protein